MLDQHPGLNGHCVLHRVDQQANGQGSGSATILFPLTMVWTVLTPCQCMNQKPVLRQIVQLQHQPMASLSPGQSGATVSWQEMGPLDFKFAPGNARRAIATMMGRRSNPVPLQPQLLVRLVLFSHSNVQ